jgi:hypothetical protein
MFSIVPNADLMGVKHDEAGERRKAQLVGEH